MVDTALELLSQWIKDTLPMDEGTKILLDQVEHLKDKEKEQMGACFHNGYVEGVSEHAGLPRKYTVFDDYYNTVFGQRKPLTSDALFKNKKD